MYSLNITLFILRLVMIVSGLEMGRTFGLQSVSEAAGHPM